MDMIKNIGEKQEAEKLLKLFKDVEPGKLRVVVGLIDRAAFLVVKIRELEADIKVNGVTELFTQNKSCSYDRERPAVKTYTAFLVNYRGIVKQLLDLLPEQKAEEVEDELMKFLQRHSGQQK